MLQGEARKGDWSIFVDAIYLNFGRHSTTVQTRVAEIWNANQKVAVKRVSRAH
jgi:hypothetical protein